MARYSHNTTGRRLNGKIQCTVLRAVVVLCPVFGYGHHDKARFKRGGVWACLGDEAEMTRLKEPCLVASQPVLWDNKVHDTYEDCGLCSKELSRHLTANSIINSPA